MHLGLSVLLEKLFHFVILFFLMPLFMVSTSIFGLKALLTLGDGTFKGFVI